MSQKYQELKQILSIRIIKKILWISYMSINYLILITILNK